MPVVREFRKPNHTPYDLAFLLQATEEDYYAKADPSLCRDALSYQATRFAHLEPMMEHLALGPDDVFVDYGCGKGRIVCYVALQGIVRKVVGVELRQELAEYARARIREIRPATPIEIVHQDAATYTSRDGTVFYLFNPFGQITLQRVLRNIHDSIEANPRPVRIVYNNCVHGDCLDEAGWLVRAGGISGTDIAVWRSR
jgi:SAM-dependent methyltransferase